MKHDGDRPRPAQQDGDSRRIPASPTTPTGVRPTERPPTVGQNRWRTPAICALVAVVLVSGMVTATSLASPSTKHTTPTDVASAGTGALDPVVTPAPVSAADLAALPQATTFGTIASAPIDESPEAVPSGRVIHPQETVAVFRNPGGPPIAALPSQQLGSDTWLPVLAEEPGWALVALPTRPNGATGWVYIKDPQITIAHTPYRIAVDRAAYLLLLFKDNNETARWTIGIGKPRSATPLGRTFILASIRDIHPTFSPVVLPLGAHSDTYTSYGGGPGTVAIHTWPTDDVYGRASSDGCIRIPSDALQVLATVPLGTAVLIK